MKNKGFTLIELIVVIAIIAILAAIISPSAFKAIEKAQVAATIADLQAIRTAAMSYYSDLEAWPTDCGVSPCNGLIVGDTSTGWAGPYLDKWPAQARWNTGGYLLRRANDSTATVGSFNWSGGATTPDTRVISVSQVPISSAKSIEKKIDGTAAPGNSDSTGLFRYPGNDPTTCYFFISND